MKKINITFGEEECIKKPSSSQSSKSINDKIIKQPLEKPSFTTYSKEYNLISSQQLSNKQKPYSYKQIQEKRLEYRQEQKEDLNELTNQLSVTNLRDLQSRGQNSTNEEKNDNHNYHLSLANPNSSSIEISQSIINRFNSGEHNNDEFNSDDETIRINRKETKYERKDNNIDIIRTSEEIQRVLDRAIISFDEKEMLIETALAIDTVGSARQIVQQQKEKWEERQRGRNNRVNDDKSSFIIDENGEEVISIDSLTEEQPPAFLTSTLNIASLKSASQPPTDDQLFFQAVEEVERVKARLLARAELGSNANTPIITNPILPVNNITPPFHRRQENILPVNNITPPFNQRQENIISINVEDVGSYMASFLDCDNNNNNNNNENNPVISNLLAATRELNKAKESYSPKFSKRIIQDDDSELNSCLKSDGDDLGPLPYMNSGNSPQKSISSKKKSSEIFNSQNSQEHCARVLLTSGIYEWTNALLSNSSSLSERKFDVDTPINPNEDMIRKSVITLFEEDNSQLYSSAYNLQFNKDIYKKKTDSNTKLIKVFENLDKHLQIAKSSCDNLNDLSNNSIRKDNKYINKRMVISASESHLSDISKNQESKENSNNDNKDDIYKALMAAATAGETAGFVIAKRLRKNIRHSIAE
jgi:hypothetical protein